MRSISTILPALALGDAVFASRILPKRDNSKTVALPLFQAFDEAYLANITVGTPPQTVTVQIDTGSSDLWVFDNSDKCNDPQGCLGGSYNPSSSSSYKNIAKGLFNSSYGDGSTATGDYMTETISFGGVTIKNMTMGLALKAQSDAPFWGIMGLDFLAGEFLNQEAPNELYYNLPYWMTAEGLINEPVFSLYLDDIDAKTSSLLFGGIDTDKFSGDLKIFDVIPDAVQGGSIYDFYTVPLTAVGGVDSKGDTASFNSQELPATVILDSGSSACTLPESLVADLYNQLGVTYSREIGGGVVPCSFANSDITLAFQFGGNNGALIGVAMAEMVTPLTVGGGSGPTIGGQPACQFGIGPGSEGNYILGDTFLRSAYVVFDPGNAQVGIAQAKLNVQNSNNQALSAVASIPSTAIGTQPATALGQGPGYGTGGIPGVTVAASTGGYSAAQTGRPGLTGYQQGGGQSINPTAASTGLHGGSSIQGIATVYQSHGAAAAASATKAAAAGPVSPPSVPSLFAAVGGGLAMMFAGLGGAACLFAGL